MTLNFIVNCGGYVHKCKAKSPEQPQQVFYQKKEFLEISQNPQESTCASLFLNKVAGLRFAILFKKRLWHRCFPVNFAEFLGTPFFIEHLQTTSPGSSNSWFFQLFPSKQTHFQSRQYRNNCPDVFWKFSKKSLTNIHGRVCFFAKLAECFLGIFRATFLQNTIRWLLLASTKQTSK